MHRPLYFFPLCFCLAACQNAEPTISDGHPQAAKTQSVTTQCQDPRPELCMQVYQPVCGLGATGEWQTYSNDCTACSDVLVVGFKNGECE